MGRSGPGESKRGEQESASGQTRLCFPPQTSDPGLKATAYLS